jgi:hypothetical protein
MSNNNRNKNKRKIVFRKIFSSIFNSSSKRKKFKSTEEFSLLKEN